MQYKYETTSLDYSDLASGRVFYSLPGHPAFPVRLASEIFQRCLASRATIYKNTTPCTLYDPCCGAAYHLSVLAYLHRNHIREIIASDIDERAIAIAQRNLGLLNVAGLDQRIEEITKMIEQYDKESHREAFASAQILKNKTIGWVQEKPLATRAFQSSATDSEAMLNNIKAKSVDMVFTDVPYGRHSQWQLSNPNQLPLDSMLDALMGVLSASSIVAVVSDKGQKVAHKSYQRVEQFQIGKRRVVILKLI
jgi:hypothetical protein